MAVDQTELIAALEEAGGVVEMARDKTVRRVQLVGQEIPMETFSLLSHFPKIQFLDLVFTQIDDANLEHVGKLKELRRLDLGACVNVTDAGIKWLKKLGNLEMLWLWDTKLGDKGMGVLAYLYRLEELYISGTQISDNGLYAIRKLPMLRGIDARATSITDVGLKYLKPLPSLEWLDISDTQITSDAAQYIVKLSRLKRLQIRHTNVTTRGAVQIKHKLPGCTVTR